MGQITAGAKCARDFTAVSCGEWAQGLRCGLGGLLRRAVSGCKLCVCGLENEAD